MAHILDKKPQTQFLWSLLKKVKLQVLMSNSTLYQRPSRGGRFKYSAALSSVHFCQ